MNRKTKRIALSAMLLAVMLILGYVESMLPAFSVPGIKIGLSNSVLLYAVYMLDIPTAFCLMALKVLLSGILFSGVSAMMYAFAGGILSLTVMSLLSRNKKLSPVIVSMTGGVSHNIGQTLLAILITETGSLFYYMAILILVGAVCGVLTGICAIQVMKHLKHIL